MTLEKWTNAIVTVEWKDEGDNEAIFDAFSTALLERYDSVFVVGSEKEATAQAIFPLKPLLQLGVESLVTSALAELPVDVELIKIQTEDHEEDIP